MTNYYLNLYKWYLATYNLVDDTDDLSPSDIKEFCESEISDDDKDVYLNTLNSYYQLTSNIGEDLGLIKVINLVDDFDEEIRESWNDFHVLEEHELDNQSIDDFVRWHNENYLSQIKRIFVEII